MDDCEKNYTAEELKEVEEWISRNIEAIVDAYRCQSIENLSCRTKNYFDWERDDEYLGFLCLRMEETFRMAEKVQEIMSGGKYGRYEIEVTIKEKGEENYIKED